MVTRRMIPLFLVLLGVGLAGAAAQSDPTPEAGDEPHEGQAVDASTVVLPCTPVAAWWSGPPPSSEVPPGPDLAVVSVDVRPKDARVHLDGRFVGRARYLDGKPGYLYLEPGSYRLELRLDGYRTVAVDLEARSTCRYDLKHRLERAGAKSPGKPEDAFGKGMPLNRVFSPITEAGPAQTEGRAAGPDPSLRPDLDERSKPAAESARKPTAALTLRVSPESAEVSIDGVFVATARELGRMEGPLATTAGEHVVSVRAPGFAEASKSVRLAEGEIVELEISLSPDRTD